MQQIPIPKPTDRSRGEHDSSGADERREQMHAIVGLWRDRDDMTDSEEFVRSLRQGDRLQCPE